MDSVSELLVVFGSSLSWLEESALARMVSESLPLTASLSAIHALGFTLITGAALVANLRLLGAVLAERPVLEVALPASRVIVCGLVISIATGALLFSGKATAAMTNGIFQAKMLLLAGAVVFHFVCYRAVARKQAPVRTMRLTGIFGLALWVGLATAACAFILLE
jgi:hypothetical protein